MTVDHLVPLSGVRLVDPGPAREAAVENDLENAPGFFPVVLRQRKRILELFEDQLNHAFQLAPLLRGQVIEVRLHQSMPSKLLRSLHLCIASNPHPTILRDVRSSIVIHRDQRPSIPRTGEGGEYKRRSPSAPDESGRNWTVIPLHSGSHSDVLELERGDEIPTKRASSALRYARVSAALTPLHEAA